MTNQIIFCLSISVAVLLLLTDGWNSCLCKLMDYLAFCRADMCLFANQKLHQDSWANSNKKNDKNGNKQRKRKIIWYNPPYSANIKTNIGKTFLNLIKKHFPKTNKLHKIFNKNTVKISYSCMNNISSIISGHNKNLLNPNVTQYGCNCRIREDCPLQNQCLTPNIIYRVDVHCKVNKDHKFYFGVARTPFKGRFRNHNRYFNHEQYIKRAIQIYLVAKRCRKTIHHQLVNSCKSKG